MIVFLNAYVKKNLGDDLFIKLLSDRYKKHNFLISSKAKYLNQDNLIFYFDKDKVNYALKALSLGRVSLQYMNMRNVDYSVSIGGSMYIERNYKGLKKSLYRALHIHKYDYIIGANFGPYKSNKFYKKYYQAFKRSKDVCFRDKYSYDLFKNINHCRYAPDIIFSLDISKYTNNNSKRIIISVIDCFKRFSGEIAKNYYNKIVEIINFYRDSNYKVCLMSFCKSEGDEEAIRKILSMFDDKNNIETYFYDGDIDNALNNIGDSSIVIGTRFHANVLGMIFGKKVIPISYSDKTVHMLEDIGFKGVSYDIRNVDSFDITKLNDLSNNTIDISNVKKEALLHFRELDKVLK